MVNQEKSKVELALVILLLIVIIILFSIGVDSKCSSEQQRCNALASYYVWDGSNLTYISKLLSSSPSQIQIYNPQITNPDSVHHDTRVNVPFSCACIGELGFLGHEFVYEVQSEETYKLIAEKNYASLTTVEMLQRFNGYGTNRIPVNATVNVVVNCSCGNRSVSKDYGLFISYSLRPGENLSTIAAEFNLSQQLLKDFNPNSDFSGGTGLVFIPGKDQNGTYPPFKSSSSGGITGGVIAGITVAGVAGAMLLAIGFYVGFYRRNKVVKGSLLREAFDRHAHGQGPERTLENPSESGSEFTLENTSESGPLVGGVSLGLTGITVDKSVEFSYEELAKATDDFSLANKIGMGGFGSVYYAELRGEKAAIKKMDMSASKEFLVELKVLTHVHHLNLVRLIGYCVEGSLFLVYEFIENGNLSQHLRGLGRDPLPWSTRVQIALDSARGLEYIHEHTVPVYVHRDIKSANILIDKNFCAKVADFGLAKLTEVGKMHAADFGLAKLTEVGSTSFHTRLVGTFGYIPPEYARSGDVSPKIDVYAFGVVLYELISAKEALFKADEVVTEFTRLVALFEDTLKQPDPKQDLQKLVDPRLGDDYPLDSVCKIAHLARACTQENPQLRPSMRSIVGALMTLSSSTEDWDVGSFYGNPGLVNLMSGR